MTTPQYRWHVCVLSYFSCIAKNYQFWFIFLRTISIHLPSSCHFRTIVSNILSIGMRKTLAKKFPVSGWKQGIPIHLQNTHTTAEYNCNTVLKNKRCFAVLLFSERFCVISFAAVCFCKLRLSNEFFILNSNRIAFV